MTKKSISLICWILILQLIGYFLGQMTQHNIATWYLSLHKSSLTPPGIVFPIAWSILYTMLAISGWSLWQYRGQQQAKIALGVFSIQMLMNWLWTPLFFQLHLVGLSFFWIIGIALMTLITILLTKKRFKLSCIMLTPYFLWLVFASYLNGAIWILNP